MSSLSFEATRSFLPEFYCCFCASLGECAFCLFLHTATKQMSDNPSFHPYRPLPLTAAGLPQLFSKASLQADEEKHKIKMVSPSLGPLSINLSLIRKAPSRTPSGLVLERRIGGGGDGEVYTAYHTDGRQVAIKVMNRSRKRQATFQLMVSRNNLTFES